jgi:hypothetical protein
MKEFKEYKIAHKILDEKQQQFREKIENELSHVKGISIYSEDNIRIETEFFSTDIYNYQERNEYDVRKICNSSNELPETPDEITAFINALQEDKKEMDKALDWIATWFKQ